MHGACFQPANQCGIKLVFFENDATPGSTKCVTGAYNQWISNALGNFFAFQKTVGNLAFRNSYTKFSHSLPKFFTIFHFVNGSNIYPNYAAIVFLPNSQFVAFFS